MPVEPDDERVQPLARERVVRHIAAMARLLHRSPLVDFDLTSPTLPQEDLLFALSYFGIGALEGQSGADMGVAGPAPGDAAGPKDGGEPPVVRAGAARLHGLVGDDTLAEGIERARKAVGASAPVAMAGIIAPQMLA